MEKGLLEIEISRRDIAIIKAVSPSLIKITPTAVIFSKICRPSFEQISEILEILSKRSCLIFLPKEQVALIKHWIFFKIRGAAMDGKEDYKGFLVQEMEDLFIYFNSFFIEPKIE